MKHSWKNEFPGITFYNYKSEKKEYEVEYDIGWEVDDLRTLLENRFMESLIRKAESLFRQRSVKIRKSGKLWRKKLQVDC